MRRHLQPLGMLVEHRINDVDERLIAIEHPVPPREQIPFQPAFALMLAQHLHSPPGRCQKLIVRLRRRVPLPPRGLKHRLQAVGQRFVRTKDPEIPLGIVQLHHVAQKRSQHMHITNAPHPRRGHRHRIFAEIRHAQIPQQLAAIRMRVRPHPPVTLRRQLCQFRFQPARFIKQLRRAITAQPFLQLLEMPRMRGRIRQRYLMRPERPLHLQTIHHFRPRPALRRIQHNQRPPGPHQTAPLARIRLDALDLFHRHIQRRRHRLVHLLRFMPFHEIRRPPVTPQQLVQLLVRDPRQHCGIGNLVTVQM